MYAQPSFTQNLTRGKVFSGGCVDAYLFGFNGKEKLDEAYGDNNAYDFGARLYDPRIGRFLSIDPKSGTFPQQSPYIFATNSPIAFIDREGEDNIIYLVVLPSGKQKLSKADWNKVQQNADKYFRMMNLNTRVVIKPYNDFNPDYLDPTDSYTLVGTPDAIRKYMVKGDGSLKSEKYAKLYTNIKGWEGSTYNPEESAVGDYDNQNGKPASLAPGIAISSNDIGNFANEAGVSLEEMLGITIAHGSTHNTGLKVLGLHHPDGASQNAGALVNYLTGKLTYAEGQRYEGTQKHTVNDVFHPDNNKEVKKAIKATFGMGYKQDNYEKNKAKKQGK